MEKSLKSPSHLFERILKEQVNYYDLESFLNQKQPMKGCRITIPEMDPNELPIWDKYNYVSRLSTEAGYVYELLSVCFVNEDYPTIESILGSVKKQGLFIPLFDLSFYLLNNTGYSNFSFVPYMDGNEVKFLQKGKDYQMTRPKYFTETQDWWVNSILEKRDITLILSTKEVIPNSIELQLIMDLGKITSKVESSFSPFYEDGLKVNDLLKIIRDFPKPFDLVQKIVSSNLELEKFVNSVIESITERIEFYTNNGSSSSGGEGRH